MNFTNPMPPTVGRRTLRLVLAGALACSVGFGAFAFPSFAYADNGSVTIAAKNNQAAVYNVYELFKADIAPAPDGAPANIDGVATHIAWAVSGAAYDRIHAFLLDSGMTEADAANPQKAAEFIGEHIAAGPWDADAATTPQTPAAQSFANGLAKALASSGATPQSYTAGAAFTSEEGYYLFVTNDESVGVAEAGTAAAWVPLGGKTTSIAEKTAIPGFDKLVKEDSTGKFGHAGDSENMGGRTYRLVANMPDNIDAYTSYHLKFTDTLPSGMSTAADDTSSVVVRVNDIDVTSQLRRSDITFSENILTVDIANLLALESVEIDKNSSVSVEYEAHLTSSAVKGSAGNGNTAELTYTNNPVTLAEGTSEPGITTTYSYNLSVGKVDKATGDGLAGAKITVLSKATGKYVQADGSLGDAAHEFTTGKNGSFEVKGIDSGVYTLHETTPPANYEPWDADIELTISATFNQTTGALTKLMATASGGEATKTNETDVVTNIQDVNQRTGLITLQTSDDKKIPLPITGMDGITLVTVLGISAVVIATVGLIISRRRRNDDWVNFDID